MITINLSTLNVRINKEMAIAMNLTWIDTNPDFQREYQAWDDKLKTKLIETLLIGRSMNPIWTILNKNEKCEEILDGMHRTKTCISFLNNEFKLSGKYLTEEKFKKYSNKYFRDLSQDDQANIRNYNFIINNLDSTYRDDINKLKEMYEILNRSSKTLNDYEFNKVLYSSFYDIIKQYKESFNIFLNKKDHRGCIENNIIDCFFLSKELQKSWSSINDLRNKFYKNELGTTQSKVNEYLKNNKIIIINKLSFIQKIIKHLNDKELFIFDSRKKFNKYFVPLKFFISRLCFKLKNISLFNRYIDKIIKLFKNDILNKDIQKELDCKSRNATFQKKLINKIDNIIDSIYKVNDINNKRFFSSKQKKEKLKEQKYKCNLCNININNNNYNADHIVEWNDGGKTNLDNLQMLCIKCHNIKTANYNSSKYITKSKIIENEIMQIR